MKQTFSLLLTLMTFACLAQTDKQFNLGFEQHSDESQLADGWRKWGQYDLSIDSLSHSGNKSGKITAPKSGGAFGSIAYRIPANYEGKTIQLEGYMKIKNVEDGFAGLFLRVDGSGGSLAFNNMQSRKITGTKDWEKYTITLPYPDEGERIYVAGILQGKGEAWFDDFKVSIDGEDLTTKKEAERPVYKADLDTAFNQGSNIAFSELTPELISNLDVLGRVWGFLKYNHPEIGAGNYNWDYELFRFLPKYLEVKDDAARDELLLSWINGLGEISPCKDCAETSPRAYLQPDMKWLTQYGTNMSSALQEKLKYVYTNRHQGEHYYIKMVTGIGNPQFKNEQAYPEMTYPDAGFRLLALYRYWNMIHYFFPYKHLTDKDWNQVLKAYIPRFVNAEDELSYEIAALKIIGDIQDTHANLWRGGDKLREQRGQYYPAVNVRFIEGQLVVTDYYNPELKTETALEIGDVITQINGKKVEEIIKEQAEFYPASKRSGTATRSIG